jgi:Family of unknown function (DUF6519)
MKGDFTRNTFDPMNHYSRVLMQQGRVQLDADWNEQGAILMHYLRSLAADLIGAHGGPGDGFKIVADAARKNDFNISRGHYYVQGVPAENEAENAFYKDQSGFPPLEGGKSYVVYLDVWERHITFVEDDGIREKALSGPDTATRAKVIWQAKVKEYTRIASHNFKTDYGQFLDFLNNNRAPNVAGLRARAMKSPPGESEPCLIVPEARYRGPENQLYRVEIHTSGELGLANATSPTFKWSRENGSVIFPIKMVEGFKVTLEHPGRDVRFGLKQGDWVEIANDDSVLQNAPGQLWQIESIDTTSLLVTLKPKTGTAEQPLQVLEGDTRHPLLRRWESPELKVEIPPTNNGWIPLEYGVEVKFGNGTYRSGDYWLIPARTATGDVEWPGPISSPATVPPHGVAHYYAPLAIISLAGDGTVTVAAADDLRRQLIQLWA